MTPLPSPQQLRYLLAFSATEHFGRAARNCAVTQSTLSAGILALERHLKTAILDRSGGKRVVFTSLAKIFWPAPDLPWWPSNQSSKRPMPPAHP